jgi:OmpA-OmpF porin, OOP family
MKKIILAVAAFAALSGTAFAQQASQAYVGAGIGQGHVNTDCSGVPECKNNDTGYKLYGGYKFTPNIAAEVTYFDFGKSKASGGGASAELRGTGLGVGVAFLGDFAPQWSGVARLGVASNRMKLSTNPNVGLDGSESSTNAYFGLGVGYEVTKGLKVTADLDFSRGKFQGETGNLRLVTVGLNYGF